MDLVEVAPQLQPPVCRIMDYSKYKYDQEKKEKEAKRKQKKIHIKEIRVKPKIEEHDYLVKLHHIEDFLKKGDKTKITLTFRGREKAHPELGQHVLDRLVKDLSNIGQIEKGPIAEGRNIIILMSPK